MARARSRTKEHRKQKITLYFEFDLTSVNIYTPGHSGISVMTDGDTEKDKAVKLIKFMYDYLEKDFTSLEKKLGVKLTEQGFFDKEGNKVHNAKI